MTWLDDILRASPEEMQPVYGHLAMPETITTVEQVANQKIAADFQADDVIQVGVGSFNPMWQSDHVATLAASRMPNDLPLPVAPDNGMFVPATGQHPNMGGYNPWTWGSPRIEKDESTPEVDPYGEPSTLGKGGAFVGEWGGMPEISLHFLDQAENAAVLLVPRQVRNVQGPVGRFYGPQQTAWEASYVGPSLDYWSTIILQQ